MISFETKLRIRYSETDKMGYAYYGNYPQYYEVGRVELMRSMGFSYRELEDIGIMMPVINMQIKYIQPSFYDDEITIRTSMPELPTTRALFHYEVLNTEGKIVNEGETTLVFIKEGSRRPQRAPQEMIDRIKHHFVNE